MFSLHVMQVVIINSSYQFSQTTKNLREKQTIQYIAF